MDAYEGYNGGTNCTQAALYVTSAVAEYPFVGNSDAHDPNGLILNGARTIVFSVNRTVNGIFDAVLNHRAVVKLSIQHQSGIYVGNRTLASILKRNSKMFEAKAAIGSAEISIVKAREETYITQPSFDAAQELIRDSLRYYWDKDYDNAIAAAQQVKDTIMRSITLKQFAILAAAGTAVSAIYLYRKRRHRARSPNL